MKRLIGALCFLLTSCSHSYEYKPEPIARPQQHCDPTIAVQDCFLQQMQRLGFEASDLMNKNREVGTVAEFHYSFYKYG
jgi:starvation-inducible outer membrane lipoprotein